MTLTDIQYERWLTSIAQVSRRATRMRLVLHPINGLELVVPPQTTPEEMRALMEHHKVWAVDKSLELEAPLDARHCVEEEYPVDMPLLAVGEHWEVRLTPTERMRSVAFLRFDADSEPAVIHVCHPVQMQPSAGVVVALLRDYLRDRAKAVLAPWLERLAVETGLERPTRVSIRFPQTRWGSCGCDGRFSLNGRLLFLPPELVRLVLIHELCHTVISAHGPEFRQLELKHNPQVEELDRQLEIAQSELPAWCWGLW